MIAAMPSSPGIPRAPVPEAADDLFRRARRGLREAAETDDAQERFVLAHLAALRAAAAVVSSRTAPARRRPMSVWVLLERAMPDLGEWSAYFGASAPRRAGIETGRETVSDHEADELLRDAEVFVGVVAGILGLPAPEGVSQLALATELPA